MLDLDRFFESADDDPMSGENASCGVIFDRYREFSALARRLEADEKSLGMETHSQELEALWERRSQLARELVDTPAPAIADVVFKMTIVSSLVAEGEVRLGLTQQCVEECERALAVETVAEQAAWRLSLRYGVHVKRFARNSQRPRPRILSFPRPGGMRFARAFTRPPVTRPGPRSV
jgi:hypothetical protein